jgi:hypothetical protein
MDNAYRLHRPGIYLNYKLISTMMYIFLELQETPAQYEARAFRDARGRFSKL